MVSQWKKTFIWLLYLPIALIIIFLAINLLIQGELFTIRYLLLLLLGAMIALYPIKTIEDRDFSLGTGVSIVTFVVFGLVHELLLTSLAFFLLMRRLNIEGDQHYRYPLNLLAVSVQSTLSAGGYYVATSFFGGLDEWARLFISLSVYLLIHSLTNNLNMFFAYKFFYNIKQTTYNRKTLVFSITTNIIFLFVSMLFIYLYLVYGITGQIIGSFLFFILTANFNYYYRTKRNDIYLSEVNQHVAKMTKNLNRKDVIYSFITSLLEVFPIDRIYYFKVINEETLEPKRVFYNDETHKPLDMNDPVAKSRVIKETILTNKISDYRCGEEWWPDELINDSTFTAESAITIPVNILGSVKGVILLVNEQRSAYTEFILSLIKFFYQYFTNVLHNADQYEKLEESLAVDELTQLANFRGFSEKIKTVSEEHNFEELSIIILDLDFFKKVNDTHGHNAGNEVLVQLAEVLKGFQTEDRFISRYGGEEFIFLLKNHSKEVAYELAEEIRNAIAEKIYYVNQSIVEPIKSEVQVTASFGVATYPDDTNDVYKLVLLADGVMYKKSKQSGRNRVSVFIK